MTHSFTSHYLHLVFSVKQRRPLITPEIRDRLYSYLGGIARNKNCVLDTAGGMPDHVHLLVSLHAEISLAELVDALKANSSRWLAFDENAVLE